MFVQLAGPDGPRRWSTPVSPEHDFTGQIHIDGLHPGTTYPYRVWFSHGSEGAPREAAEGRFRTAPEPTRPAPVTFAFSGDLACQNVCRDVERGFPIFGPLNAIDLDFFVDLGGMISGDNVCDEVGRFGNRQLPGDFEASVDLGGYWAHWRYNREDAGFRSFLARVPIYAIWDDHEVVNDFGPHHDAPQTAPDSGLHLLPIGLAAFLNYNPIEPAPTPGRLYRSFRWGRHVQLILLDNRQYRDPNSLPDTGEAPKTMLGAEQRRWFERQIAESDATWRVIVSSVPMSIPTGFPPGGGRDGWADHHGDTGFERELRGLLAFFRDQNVRNSLWITTDVHFAAAFRYTPFAEDTEFHVYELAVGPLSGGLFPNRAYNRTLGTERLFFHGPENAESVGSYDEALRWMNFGLLHVDEDGTLRMEVRDAAGETLYALDLRPESDGWSLPAVPILSPFSA